MGPALLGKPLRLQNQLCERTLWSPALLDDLGPAAPRPANHSLC
jgi:hypothetical protein